MTAKIARKRGRGGGKNGSVAAHELATPVPIDWKPQCQLIENGLVDFVFTGLLLTRQTFFKFFLKFFRKKLSHINLFPYLCNRKSFLKRETFFAEWRKKFPVLVNFLLRREDGNNWKRVRWEMLYKIGQRGESWRKCVFSDKKEASSVTGNRKHFTHY